MDVSNRGQPSPSTSPIVLPKGADSQVQLKIEPTIKEVVIVNAIQGAKKSIWGEMYEFTDSDVAVELNKAALNNIDVKLLYDQKKYNASPEMQSTLQNVAPVGHKVPAWAYVNNAKLASGSSASNCHAKFMIIDAETPNQQAFIMTANFSGTALGQGKDYNNREYVVIDTSLQDIKVLIAIFQADAQAQGPPLSLSTDSNQILTDAPNLVVSSINSYHLLQQLIESANASVAIQVEALADPAAKSSNPDQTIESTLLRAAQRVGTSNVRVMLPPLAQGGPIPAFDNSAANTTLTKAQPPVQVKTKSEYYMHAKLIIIDQKLAFIGSENLTWESLNRNREVGILISHQPTVQSLCAIFDGDWNWSGAL